VTNPISIQAHRGSPDPAERVVENSLAAFARSRRLGADGVELDVRLTADRELAVHHDPEIDGIGPVHDVRSRDLPPGVPLLAEALEACAGMVVNIEVKNLPTEAAFDPGEHVALAVVDLVESSGRAPSVIVSSFWSGALEAVRQRSADVATGLLVAPGFDPGRSLADAIRLGCAALHVPLGLVGTATVGAAHDAGLAVAAWTVSDREGLELVRSAGVDTVITDDVPLCRAVLGGGEAEDGIPRP
jgi:glycerophosphoryl diester phosphodiesterase